MQRSSRECIQRFTEVWASPTAEGFASLFAPDARCRHPLMPEPLSVSQAADYMKSVEQTLPDLRLEVGDWAAAGDTVLIEYTVSATAAGRTVRCDAAGRFTLCGDRAVEGVAYHDPTISAAALEAAQAPQAAASWAGAI